MQISSDEMRRRLYDSIAKAATQHTPSARAVRSTAHHRSAGSARASRRANGHGATHVHSHHGAAQGDAVTRTGASEDDAWLRAFAAEYSGVSATAAAPGPREDAIRVAVRVRPLTAPERAISERECASVSGNTVLLTRHPDSMADSVRYTFDSCFDSTLPVSAGGASQRDVFQVPTSLELLW